MSEHKEGELLMRKEFIEYLGGLAIADPRQSGIVEAAYFASKGGYNSVNTLVSMFRELGVLWYEAPENVTESWRRRYGSDRPNWYTKPVVYSHSRFTGKTRLQFSREAFEFLAKETMPLSEGRLPSGMEEAICRLLNWAAAQGNEEKALAAINKQLDNDRIQVVKSYSGGYVFEYGILTDSDEPLLSEADVRRRQLENGLRQLIYRVLSDAYPDGWEEKLGLSEERLEKIRLKMEEMRRKAQLRGEYSLLDFSEFYDLITIVRKCWSYLGGWLKDRDEAIVFLSTLHSLRNEMVHVRPPSREDLMLAIGIASRLCERIKKGLMSTTRGRVKASSIRERQRGQA
jgi:hypothetical protein